MQVLCERGLIDGKNTKKYYTLDRKTDAFGIIDHNTSLRHIMSMHNGFLHEYKMLERIAAKLETKVLLTPRCHAEGVEYMWALSLIHI